MIIIKKNLKPFKWVQIICIRSEYLKPVKWGKIIYIT